MRELKLRELVKGETVNYTSIFNHIDVRTGVVEDKTPRMVIMRITTCISMESLISFRYLEENRWLSIRDYIKPNSNIELRYPNGNTFKCLFRKYDEENQILFIEVPQYLNVNEFTFWK